MRLRSHGEQNLIILTYATPDGTRDFRKERALTTFSGAGPETPVSVTVPESNLGRVDDEATQERYRSEVERMREKHDADATL